MKIMKQHLLLALMLLPMIPAMAAGPVFTGDTDEVALEGHDVVAYFTEGRPMQGSPEHSHRWQGAVWQFASEQHLDLFRENPERYAPAYGGHCAWGVANGRKLASSPEHWVIHDGRLYLNLNEEVQGSWKEALESNIREANNLWPDQVD